jgi:glycosyltransferase involved in cell wall biosynthesis
MDASTSVNDGSSRRVRRVASAKKRLAIVASHPIQHFVPLYRELAKQSDLELRVFFCARIGLDAYLDPGFGVQFRWETNLLDGYESEFLEGAEKVKAAGFWSIYGEDVAARLNRFKPDVVQVYGYAQLAALRTLAWCTLHRVPVLMMSDSELVHHRPLHVRAAKKAVLPLLYRGVSGFLTIGDNNEAYLRHYGVGAQRMFRSPYPTNDEHFLAALANRGILRAQARAKLEIAESAFVALFVGKLIERKRPADLLAAVEHARRQSGRDIVAVFAGDGALRRELEEQLRRGGPECARFAGFINQAELPSMYALADVVAHPADNDPHPIAVTEGVLMGLPVVVSSRVGSVGPTDTVRRDQNGLVFPVGDVPAFAAALERLAGDRELHERMSKVSRHVGDEMGMHASVKGYVRAIRAAVD